MPCDGLPGPSRIASTAETLTAARDRYRAGTGLWRDSVPERIDLGPARRYETVTCRAVKDREGWPYAGI